MSPTLCPPAHRPIVDDEPMRFDHALDHFIADKRQRGDINSDTTEALYRSVLGAHCDDVGYRDPRNTTRDHVKITLSRWNHPNTAGKNLAVMRSFYRWCMEEGIRRDNPAEQVPRPRRRASNVYRLTRGEVQALWSAAHTTRERRIVFLGVGAGLRNRELRGLQGRHFQRPGFVHVSADIAKGGKERYIPIIADLEPVVADIRATVGLDDYVLPARRWHDFGEKRRQVDHPHLPCSPQSLKTAMENLGKRAGIDAHLHPHLMRHAFGDHIARGVGLKVAQQLMGHADVSTTEATYTGRSSLDELASALSGFTFLGEQAFPSLENHPQIPREAPTGIEPVYPPSWLIDREDEYKDGS